ncbi:hypothetical protein A8144_11930 [Mycobacterium leprae 3125609]|nr:hypothetical protein A8144_11930 [Mycobacterium leprae 3125609]OAX70512.1 hypothetical protein A3216_11565 [Mycobacterium leprae 7935681]
MIIAIGHLLASNHHNQILEELGEPMEELESAPYRLTYVNQSAMKCEGASLPLDNKPPGDSGVVGSLRTGPSRLPHFIDTLPL